MLDVLKITILIGYLLLKVYIITRYHLYNKINNIFTLINKKILLRCSFLSFSTNFFEYFKKYTIFYLLYI